MTKLFNLVKTRPGLLAMAVLVSIFFIGGSLSLQKSTASAGNGDSATVPANWDCQFEANTYGSLQSTNIYLRNNSQITLASDDQKGNRTWTTLPQVFQHGSGTSPKMDMPLPNGTFKVIMKVRLAGNKIGFVWLPKRNVVKLEVHDGSATGPIVASSTIDRSVGSPTDYTMTTNVYSPNQPLDTFKSYYIMIFFDKYDSNGSNDGQCGMEIRVRSI
jgi:hypothetical protein